MPTDPMIQYWVTYGNSFRPEGTVHRMGCDHFDKGYGRLLTPEDVNIEARKAKDCRKCGGRWKE